MALSPASAGATNAEQRTPAFDGAWWSIASADERLGFLYALDDCLSFDRTPALWFDGKWSNHEKKIAFFYKSRDKNRRVMVQDVFERFGKTPSGSRADPERYGDEFWRAHTGEARRGFVEGYISCRSRYRNSPNWGHPIGYYISKIDDLYNVDDRFGEDAQEFEGSVSKAMETLSDH